MPSSCVPLSPELLSRPANEVAPLLLGAVLRHGGVAVRLTEVEAYGGSDDAGSHAWRGRTPRNATMFGPPGRLYCYLSYGVHTCANVVTGREGVASAVLLRAGEVVDGLATARARRPGVADRQLARGPGVLCRALALDLTLDGVDLLAPDVAGPALGAGDEHQSTPVLAGPRVGLSKEADRPWRFSVTGHPSVTTYRRSPRAPAPGSHRTEGPC